MKNIGPIAVVCIGLLTFAYAAGMDPLFVALGVIGLLGYVAFANFDIAKRKPPEEMPQEPWYMK